MLLFRTWFCVKASRLPYATVHAAGLCGLQCFFIMPLPPHLHHMRHLSVVSAASSSRAEADATMTRLTGDAGHCHGPFAGALMAESPKSKNAKKSKPSKTQRKSIKQIQLKTYCCAEFAYTCQHDQFLKICFFIFVSKLPYFFGSYFGPLGLWPRACRVGAILPPETVASIVYCRYAPGQGRISVGASHLAYSQPCTDSA